MIYQATIKNLDELIKDIDIKPTTDEAVECSLQGVQRFICDGVEGLKRCVCCFKDHVVYFSTTKELTNLQEVSAKSSVGFWKEYSRLIRNRMEEINNDIEKRVFSQVNREKNYYNHMRHAEKLIYSYPYVEVTKVDDSDDLGAYMKAVYGMDV